MGHYTAYDVTDKKLKVTSHRVVWCSDAGVASIAIGQVGGAVQSGFWVLHGFWPGCANISSENSSFFEIVFAVFLVLKFGLVSWQLNGKWKFGTTLCFAQLYMAWRQLLVEQSCLLTSDAACVVFRLRLRRTSRGLPPPTDARLPHLSMLHWDQRNST